jgi:hypothetical protein
MAGRASGAEHLRGHACAVELGAIKGERLIPGLAPLGYVHELLFVLVAGDPGSVHVEKPSGLLGHRCDELGRRYALGHPGRHTAQRRLLVGDFTAGALGDLGAARCMSRELADKDGYSEVSE